MAAECTQENILDFLKANGGKVKNTDLVAHFKAVFPEEPERRAAVRERFKNYVDNVAFVKTESGVKYVCLKKKFREKCDAKMENGGRAEDRYLAGDSSTVSGGDDAAGEPALPHARTAPGSGYGNNSQVRVPRAFATDTIVPRETDGDRPCHEFVCVVEDTGRSGEMGNAGSFWRERRESRKSVKSVNAPDIPEITVIEASPLPAEGSVFTLPGPAQTGSTGQVSVAAAGLSPTDRHVKTEESLGDREDSQGRFLLPESDTEDDGHLDSHSLSGSEPGSPRGSRKHFIELMMNSSPDVRRSLVLRGSVCLPSRSDSDSASLVSSNLDEDRASVTLDPVEHEWMMCASDGEWASLHRLLAMEPSLILRKDFVTGFTCLHWAAKHGKPELMALIINFAKQNNVPVSVDVRSNTGYTPLHIAAMHGHMEVVKLLVGAYNADVEVRDYSGRKACQYLTDNASVDIRDIIGAYERSEVEDTGRRGGGRWRFSKVPQLNLKPLRLLHPNDSVDGEERPREKPLRRKSSLSRMKPKLQRLRVRTSQIIHSTSFHDRDDLEARKEERTGSFKSRPHTHFFG